MEKLIKTSEILDDLNRGLTRTNRCKGYDPTLGSIQDKYELTNKEVKYLFSQPALKGKRVKSPVRFTLIDDTPTRESSLRSSVLTAYGDTGRVLITNSLATSFTVERPSLATIEEAVEPVVMEENSSQINNNTQQETFASGNTPEENW